MTFSNLIKRFKLTFVFGSSFSVRSSSARLLVFFFLFSLLLQPLDALSQTNNAALKLKQKTVSASVEFEGDFAGRFDFSGKLNSELPGEPSTEATQKNPENCSMNGYFSEAKVKRGSRLLDGVRLRFTFKCRGSGSESIDYKSSLILIAFVELSQTAHRLHFSEKMREFQFRIREITIQ